MTSWPLRLDSLDSLDPQHVLKFASSRRYSYARRPDGHLLACNAAEPSNATTVPVLTNTIMPNASDKALDKLVDFVANHDFVAGEERNVEKISAERQALGLAPLAPDERHLNYVANIPSCDFCGKPEAGKHHCSRCECAFVGVRNSEFAI